MTYDKNAVQRKYRKSAKGKAADERWKKSAKYVAQKQKLKDEYKLLTPNQRRRRKEYQRSIELLRRVGITWKQKKQKYKEQKGLCAICHKHMGSLRKSHSDHEHDIKKFRALLCGRCNTLVGYIESSWDLLEPTLDYLAFHGSL